MPLTGAIPFATAAPPAALPFSPASLSGLQLWVAARQISGLVEAAAVASWPDLSGLARHLVQATGSKQPRYRQGVVNGLPVVRFDGVDDALQSPAFTLPQPYTRICVLRLLAWTLNKYVSDGKTASSTNMFMDTTTPKVTMVAGAVGPSTTALAVGTFGVLSEIFNGASSTLRVNNGVAATGNTGANAAGGLTLGSRGDMAANFCFVEFAEVLLFNRALSGAEESQISAYLGTTYNLTVAP